MEAEVMSYHSPRHVWAIQNKRIINALIITSGVISIVIFFFLDRAVAFWLVPVAIASIGYSVPIFPTGNGWIRFRDIPYLKVLLIAGVVAIVTVVLPIVQSGSQLIWEHRVIWLERFLFVLAITIPFDIRDMAYDKENKLLTVPSAFGVNTAKAVSILSLVGFALTVNYSNYSFNSELGLLISALASTMIVLVSNINRSEYFYSLFVEGTMILKLALVLLINRL